MSELYEKSLRKLELDQVLQLLAECAGSEGGKEACLSLQPSSDLEGTAFAEPGPRTKESSRGTTLVDAAKPRPLVWIL